MKIALVVPGGVDRSGRERVIPALLWFIERLARKHSVLVLTTRQSRNPSRYSLLGAEVMNLGYSHTLIPGVNRMIHLMKIIHEVKYQFDADILHGFWAGATGFLAVCVGKMLNKPVVVTIAGGELIWIPQIRYGSQGTFFDRFQITWTLQGANRITAGSRFVIGLSKERKIRPDWLPLGVDTNLLTADIDRVDGPPWSLIHVGSINPVKNQTLLLESLQILLDQGCDIYLDCVGEDTLNGNLQRLALQMGLQNRVRFYGYLPLEDILPLYKKAHLFIQTSLFEAQGVAVCEAAAMGVPSIGTNVGIVSELSPVSAVAIPGSDRFMLASEIQRLLVDNLARREIARNAQSWAQKYNADWTASAFLNIYDELRMSV